VIARCGHRVLRAAAKTDFKGITDGAMKDEERISGLPVE
jgi:hypothetical protein